MRQPVTGPRRQTLRPRRREINSGVPGPGRDRTTGRGRARRPLPAAPTNLARKCGPPRARPRSRTRRETGVATRRELAGAVASAPAAPPIAAISWSTGRRFLASWPESLSGVTVPPSLTCRRRGAVFVAGGLPVGSTTQAASAIICRVSLSRRSGRVVACRWRAAEIAQSSAVRVRLPDLDRCNLSVVAPLRRAQGCVFPE
jgi:hypothetical protein